MVREGRVFVSAGWGLRDEYAIGEGGSQDVKTLIREADSKNELVVRARRDAIDSVVGGLEFRDGAAPAETAVDGNIT